MSITDINEALLTAATNGNLDAVQQCMQAGATKQGLALHISSDQGHLAIVQYLLSLNASQEDKNEALWYAVSSGYLPIVKCLVNDGADHRAKDSRVVIVAAEDDHLEITQFLVESGADLKVVESYGDERVQRWLKTRK